MHERGEFGVCAYASCDMLRTQLWCASRCPPLWATPLLWPAGIWARRMDLARDGQAEREARGSRQRCSSVLPCTEATCTHMAGDLSTNPNVVLVQRWSKLLARHYRAVQSLFLPSCMAALIPANTRLQSFCCALIDNFCTQSPPWATNAAFSST